MIVHQAVGVTEAVVAFYSLAEGCEERLIIPGTDNSGDSLLNYPIIP